MRFTGRHTLVRVSECLCQLVDRESFSINLTGQQQGSNVFIPTVVVAQLVEPQIVILVVAGSSPVDHPIFISA